MLTADAVVDWDPRRVLITGVTGSGKTTLCARIGERLGVPATEMDALHWGEGWVERTEFRADAAALAAEDAWVTELQYQSKLGDKFVERADTLVWLDLPEWVSLGRLVRRTVTRSLLREQIWGRVVEPPLWTVFTDRDHIIRWWWKTRKNAATRVPRIATDYPDLRIVRLRTLSEVERWVSSLRP